MQNREIFLGNRVKVQKWGEANRIKGPKKHPTKAGQNSGKRILPEGNKK